MTTTQIEVSSADLQAGDTIVRTHGGGQFLVEREIETFPYGTIVECMGNTGVKTQKYGWIVVDRDDRWPQWDDALVSKLRRSGSLTVRFNPKED